MLQMKRTYIKNGNLEIYFGLANVILIIINPLKKMEQGILERTIKNVL